MHGGASRACLGAGSPSSCARQRHSDPSEQNMVSPEVVRICCSHLCCFLDVGQTHKRVLSSLTSSLRTGVSAASSLLPELLLRHLHAASSHRTAPFWHCAAADCLKGALSRIIYCSPDMAWCSWSWGTPKPSHFPGHGRNQQISAELF